METEKIDVRNHKHQSYVYNEKQLPSVTQCISMINKPYLVAWANKLGLAGTKTSDEMKRVTTIGTLAHAYIQAFLETKIVEFEPQNEEERVISTTALQCFSKFLAFYDEYKPTTLECEKRVVNGLFGGTMDYIARIGDENYIIDFKTSDRVSNDYLLQLSAYYELSKETPHEISKLGILSLPKELAAPYQFHVYTVEEIQPFYRYFTAARELYPLDSDARKLIERR